MERLVSCYPKIELGTLDQEIRKDRFWFNSGSISPADIDKCFTVVDAAINVFSDICQKNEITGAAFAITKRDPQTPILVIQIGDITNPDPRFIGGELTKCVGYSRDKARFLQLHPEFQFSSQNSELPAGKRKIMSISEREIIGGAVAFEEWILSASGLSKNPEVDEYAVKAIWELAKVQKAYIRHPVHTKS